MVPGDKERYAAETCSHCGGLGCTYCSGKGSVMVEQPSRRCRHCGGDGCIYCGYTGWEHPLKEY
jgi:DnaJ-class molecular chaperone